MLDFHSAQSWRCPNKRSKTVVTTKPYTLMFDKEADGGPAHILYLLREYNLSFYMNGQLIVSGIVVDADDNQYTVTVQTYTDELWSNKGEIVEVGIDSFDTVVYH